MEKAVREIQEVEEREKTKRIPSEKEFLQVMDDRFSPEVHQKLKAGKVGIAGLGGR